MKAKFGFVLAALPIGSYAACSTLDASPIPNGGGGDDASTAQNDDPGPAYPSGPGST